MTKTGDEIDARRYRWLRARCDSDQGLWWAICPPAPAAAITSAEELDEKIDRERNIDEPPSHHDTRK